MTDRIVPRYAGSKAGFVALVSLCAIAIGLMTLEGAYRLYKLKKYGMVASPSFFTVGAYLPDPVYGKVLQKNFKFEDLDPRLRNPANGVQGFDKKVSFNSLGYRGKEFSVAKPAETYRIVILGEASTLNIDVDDAETWTARLEAKLQSSGEFLRRHHVRHVEVVNGGVVGWRSREGLLRLEREVINFSPDVVIVAFNKNDPYKAMQGHDPRAPIFPADPPTFALIENFATRFKNRQASNPVTFEPMLVHLRGDASWKQAYVENIHSMKRISDKMQTHMILVNLPAAVRDGDARHAEQQLAIDSNVISAGSYDFWRKLHVFMAALMHEVGDQDRIPVMDVQRDFEKYEGRERIKLFTSGQHPSTAGSERIAEALYASRDSWALRRPSLSGR
jgi:lysophospholipase L1-like esterase